MATNSQNSYPIVANTVPVDRQCVRNGTDIVKLVQDFCNVQGLGGNSGSSFPAQDTIGQQALQLAQALQLQVASLASNLLGFRVSPSFGPVPAGANDIPISWTTPLPNNNYEVLISFQAKSGASLSAAFNWWIVAGSQTTTGCTIHFEAAPATTQLLQFSWIVLQAPIAPSGTTIINGFSPTTASISGATNISLFGSGLLGTSAVNVNGTNVATLTVVSDNQLNFTLGTGTTTGAGVITVTTGNGTTLASGLTVTS